MDSMFRVVLVEPENPLNIGFVARAMRASGVKELVIVTSSWKAVPAPAFVTGVSAPEILKEARIVTSLSSALRGSGAAVAFSRRPTGLKQEEFTLPHAPTLPARTALVFGRESTGLTRGEAAQCTYLARIPNRNSVSLNLGQAVAVVLFALTANGEKGHSQAAETASMDRLLALWNYIQPRLARAPRFTEARQRRARQMIYQLHLNDSSASLLFAVMKELAKQCSS